MQIKKQFLDQVKAEAVKSNRRRACKLCTHPNRIETENALEGVGMPAVPAAVVGRVLQKQGLDLSDSYMAKVIRTHMAHKNIKE